MKIFISIILPIVIFASLYMAFWLGTQLDPNNHEIGAVSIAPPSAINAPQGYGVMINGVMVHRVGPAAIYPPLGINGAVNPDVTQGNIQSTICKSGWTATIRPPASYTNKLKAKQLVALHYEDTKKSDYEEDHLISLELGGNPTSEQNLWPEKYPVARQKDQTEDFLKRQVCSGKITLVEAQSKIVDDWFLVYQTNIAGKLGAAPVIDVDDN